MTYGDYEPGSWGIGGLPEVWASRTGNVETADRRGGSDFPPSWGTPPPAGAYSEERAAWIRGHIAEDRRRRGGNARVALMRVLELS